MSDGGNAPSWLFSFVDLAFLLLIAMTQLADDSRSPDLGDIVVPRIEAAAAAPGTLAQDESHQLRVYPPSDEPPFALVRGADAAGEDERLDLETLRGRLVAGRAAGWSKPLLAPHEDSRSQDLLDALAALETGWPGRRRATVSPLVAGG
jgi:hypothetical protein